MDLKASLEERPGGAYSISGLLNSLGGGQQPEEAGFSPKFGEWQNSFVPKFN